MKAPSQKPLRTSDLARAVGIHPNTVRLYVDWGLIPPVERNESGYRIFTQRHLDCLSLARAIYAAAYPGRDLRALGNEIIQCAVVDDWQGALEKAHVHLAAVKAELKQADAAADLLEHWAHTCPGGRCQGNMDIGSDEEPLAIREVSKLLGVSHDVIRNWERNGLISVRRNSYNNYRLFGKSEIERLRVIRMLSRAGYSHMAILRMFIELDGGNTRDLKKVLDTPRPDEDIFTAADHWLTTLHAQEKLARHVIKMIGEIIKAKV
ncbi:MAG: MerR family transcriptional regulator [Chloroflexi bacterium]|nr:MerR family transcriptional regulator [Chloroflexota bacterium]